MKKRTAISILFCSLPFIVVTTGATPAYDTVTTYYSDATLTTVVGRKFEMCSGTTRTGTTSPYYDIWLGESCEDGSMNAWSEISASTLCNDNIDNDGDGWVDDADPGCHGF